MMEMLMLLGAGLAAAGVVGMSGILPQYGHAESAATADPGDAGMAEGESKDLLGRIREMGILPDFGKGKAKPILAEGGDDVPAVETDHGFDVTHFMQEADALDADEELALAEDMQDEPVEVLSLDVPDAVAETSQAEALQAETPQIEETRAEETRAEVTQAQVARAEAPQAPSDNEIDAMLARLGTIAQPETSADTSEADPAPEAEPFEGDDIPVISDFIAGEESLMLMLPDDMDADTIVRIEPAGETGADAAIVLEDTRGSVTAAVISGGFGAVTPADIALERAA